MDELAKGSGDPRHAEKLGLIKARTLLLWGEEDAMFKKADQGGLLKAMHWEYPERFARNSPRHVLH